mmetsp:Transcript_34369/g.75173  ORF Transcript_34369/g.75173 Transcript_34369/m.75173 type:complete len:205 (-) Transcript_34369:130-744(-)
MRSWPGSPGRTTWCHSWSRIPAACRRRPRCWIGSRARTRTPPCSSSSSPFRSTGTTTTDPASTMGSRRPWWRGRDFRWCLSQTKRILKEGSPSPKHCKSFLTALLFLWNHLTRAYFMDGSTRCPSCRRTGGRSTFLWPQRRPRSQPPRPRSRQRSPQRRGRRHRHQPRRRRAPVIPRCCTVWISWLRHKGGCPMAQATTRCERL